MIGVNPGAVFVIFRRVAGSCGFEFLKFGGFAGLAGRGFFAGFGGFCKNT